MKKSDAQHLIQTRLAEIAAESSLSQKDRAAVTLDQQSIGRLSRMDAMQQQAMAEATERRRQVETQKLRAALHRLDQGAFGTCCDCGDEIPDQRLHLDPTVLRCISCAKG